MFKVKIELSAKINFKVLPQGLINHYILRNMNHFETHFVRTFHNGRETQILDLRFGILLLNNTRKRMILAVLKSQSENMYLLIETAIFLKPM